MLHLAIAQIIHEGRNQVERSRMETIGRNREDGANDIAHMVLGEDVILRLVR